MFNKNNSIFLLLGIMISLFLFGCSEEIEIPNDVGSENLEVHYIDVGQADSILIKFPNDETLLIDAGGNSAAETVSNYLQGQDVKRLDHVIGTHPHEDHIGGLDVIINRFEIGKVYLPRVSHNTKSFEDVLLAIKGKGLKMTEAKAGVHLDVTAEVSAVFVAPNNTGYESLNDYSAVIKLTYGETSFLFTGDAEEKSEEEMLLQSRTQLTSDVLKVGHHGSVTSTSQPFLDTVSPKTAIISAGKDNDYGHPHREIIQRLEEKNIKIFRTDLQGTIIAISNGKDIKFNSQEFNHSTSHREIKKDIKILSIDLREEIVVIQNTGQDLVNLSGWKLVSVKGNDEFLFPDNFTLKAGEVIKIASGPEAVEGENVIIWTDKNVWNNSGDPGILYDEKGQEVSSLP